MIRTLLFACLATAFVTSLRAQAPAPPDQQLLAMIKEIQAQQAQITDNQAKIEQKLTIVAEAVRVARIYSSRGGH
jgi:hypothetical protein